MIDSTLRSLLLHRLPEEETSRLEDLILLEDDFAERLREAEFDLLDDYAAARLSADDARDVERYLLTSDEGRQSLRAAHALRKVGGHPRSTSAPTVDRRRRTTRVWTMVALLAACLSVVAYIPTWRLNLQQKPSVEPAWPAISLTADVNRGASRHPLTIPSDGEIRLQAEVPAPATGARYGLTVQDTGGQRLFSATMLEVRTVGRYRFVEANVPVVALGPGDRTIVLTEHATAPDAETKFTWEVTGVVR